MFFMPASNISSQKSAIHNKKQANKQTCISMISLFQKGGLIPALVFLNVT